MTSLRKMKPLCPALWLATIAAVASYGAAGQRCGATEPEQPYQPTWNSLNNRHTPQWLQG